MTLNRLTHMHRPLRAVAALALCLLLAACNVWDTFSEGMAHSQEVASDLEKSLGEKSFVGFNWNNGSLTDVSVTFEHYPAGRSFEQISSAARAAVAARFKQAPKRLVISFVAT
ncbi:MAG TPA: hypothetical protein VGN52_07045 [Burkholderiales bacterium]|jgi:hypothetical protein